MLTLNEIENVSFRKSNFAGYKPEDVDEFIDKVVESYDLLIKKNIEQKELNEQLTAENERLRNAVQYQPAEKKSSVAEEKLSEECEYTQEEIKNALLSAQKLANATIREARQKAETLLGDANAKAERIVSVAQGEVNEQKEELDRLKKLVSDFRASLLDAYKEHLKLVNALPTQRSTVTTTPPPVSNAEPTKVMEKLESQPAPAEAAAAPEQEAAAQETPQPKAEETLSQTKSFQIGKGKDGDETGEFSELKFGTDYDMTKE
jgi:cell division initiation protein